MADRWYDLTVKQLETKFHMSTATGMSRKAAARALRKQTTNTVFPIPSGSFRSYLRQILTDLTSILLVITALLSAVFEHDKTAIAIIVVLLLNLFAAIFTYVKAQRVLENMARHALPTAKVIRDGRLFLVKQEQLVPGDVICLSSGDIVPADARLISSERLTVLETSLTGEAHSVYKNEAFLEYRDIPPTAQQNMLFASSIVTGGTGRAIVCAVGENTLLCKMGKNQPLVSHEQLSILSTFKKYCSIWSLCMIGMVFVLTVLDLFLQFSDQSLFGIFLYGLTLAVASMSEFYTAFGYIIIGSGIFNAAKQNKDVNAGALIKNSASLESLRDLTCLMIPKESACSLREAKIEQVYANGDFFERGTRGFERNSAQILRYAVLTTGIYGTKKLIANNTAFDNIYTPEEDAILSIAEECNLYNVELEKQYPLIAHLAVSPENRFETTLSGSDSTNFVTLRGEAALVLRQCRYINEYGRIVPLTGEKMNTLINAVSTLSRQALRVIAIASRSTSNVNLSRLSSCQKDMTFEGFIAMREPLLPGAAVNISKCKNAGMKILMMCDEVTENNIRTAEALGIIDHERQAIDGAHLSSMRDGALAASLSRFRLYLGLNVREKQRVLTALRTSGEKVGILCRSLEEISLLQTADVGFSQRITLSSRADRSGIDLTSRNIPITVKDPKASSKTGCEAVKFLSDVILSEPSSNGTGGINALLSSIASAKVIYSNLLRMVRYLMLSQLTKFFLVLYSLITRTPLVTPLQILFCGLIVDFAAVMVIAFERPSRSILTQKNEAEEALRHPLLRNADLLLYAILWSGASILLPIVLNHFFLTASFSQYSTLVFLSYLIGQVIALCEIKRDGSLFKNSISLNRILALLIIFLAFFIFLILKWPALGALFGVITLSLPIAMTLPVIPLLLLLTFEIGKLLGNAPAVLREKRQKKRRKTSSIFGEEEDVSEENDTLYLDPSCPEKQPVLQHSEPSLPKDSPSSENDSAENSTLSPAELYAQILSSQPQNAASVGGTANDSSAMHNEQEEESDRDEDTDRASAKPEVETGSDEPSADSSSIESTSADLSD